MAKRGQNEGSIYKRKDGRWAATISLRYQGGKLKRKTFYGKIRSEVADKLAEAISDLKKGLPISTERQTVAQFLDRWPIDCVKPKARPKTLAGYKFIVERYVKPELGKIQLSQLSPQRLQAHLNWMTERGYSGRTAQLTRTVLRVALGQALKWGWSRVTLRRWSIHRGTSGPRSSPSVLTRLRCFSTPSKVIVSKRSTP